MKLALSVPGMEGNIESPLQTGEGRIIQTDSPSLGGLIGGFLNLGLMIVGFLLIIWLAWGVFQYIFAGGDKQKLQAARNRITYAIIGFVLVVMSFAISSYAQNIIKTNQPEVTKISVPEDVTTKPQK